MKHAWDIFVMLFLVVVVLSVVVSGMLLVTKSWEYRAVYHYDCASYMTES